MCSDELIKRVFRYNTPLIRSLRLKGLTRISIFEFQAETIHAPRYHLGILLEHFEHNEHGSLTYLRPRVVEHGDEVERQVAGNVCGDDMGESVESGGDVWGIR